LALTGTAAAPASLDVETHKPPNFLPVVRQVPLSNHWYLESDACQMASHYIQRLLQNARVWQMDRQMDHAVETFATLSAMPPNKDNNYLLNKHIMKILISY